MAVDAATATVVAVNQAAAKTERGQPESYPLVRTGRRFYRRPFFIMVS